MGRAAPLGKFRGRRELDPHPRALRRQREERAAAFVPFQGTPCGGLAEVSVDDVLPHFSLELLYRALRIVARADLLQDGRHKR